MGITILGTTILENKDGESIPNSTLQKYVQEDSAKIDVKKGVERIRMCEIFMLKVVGWGQVLVQTIKDRSF